MLLVWANESARLWPDDLHSINTVRRIVVHTQRTNTWPGSQSSSARSVHGIYIRSIEFSFNRLIGITHAVLLYIMFPFYTLMGDMLRQPVSGDSVWFTKNILRPVKIKQDYIVCLAARRYEQRKTCYYSIWCNTIDYNKVLVTTELLNTKHFDQDVSRNSLAKLTRSKAFDASSIIKYTGQLFDV